MRLIRLVSENNSGQFDTTFDTDIKINKGEQIALQSASFSEQINTLSLDSSNNDLSFQFKSGTSVDIKLTEADYDADNKDVLLQDITDRLNAGLVFTSGKEIGMTFKAELDTSTDKVNIGYNRSDFLSASARQARNQSAYSVVGGVNAVEPLTNKLQSTIADTTDDRAKYVNEVGWSPSGGGMMFRLKFCNFVDNNSGVDNNGITVGLSDIPPNDPSVGWTNKTTMSNAEKTYAVHFISASDNYTSKDKSQNAFQDTGHAPVKVDNSASDDNDVIEFHISENTIKAVQYTNAGATNELLNTPYIQGSRLYPFIIFHGSKDSIKVRSVVHTIDPFAVLPSDFNLENDDNHPENVVDSMVGAVPTPNFSGGNTPSDNLLSFSQSLGQFLGYNNNVLFQVSGFFTFYEADKIFLATLSNVSFIIELRNIQINSYNSDTGQRQNIVAVVPQQTAGLQGIIEYEPNNLYFIDILEDSLIRNFTARILRIDGSTPKLSGLSVITLLIK